MSGDKVKDTAQLQSGLNLIAMMKIDVAQALQTKSELVIKGEGPLKALYTVIEVAEEATRKSLEEVGARVDIIMKA